MIFSLVLQINNGWNLQTTGFHIDVCLDGKFCTFLFLSFAEAQVKPLNKINLLHLFTFDSRPFRNDNLRKLKQMKNNEKLTKNNAEKGL